MHRVTPAAVQAMLTELRNTGTRQLLLLDLAMGNQQHFEHWAEKLDDFTRSQADEQLFKFRAATPNAV